MKFLTGTVAQPELKPHGFDMNQLTSQHALIIGLTGTGKSHLIRRMLAAAALQAPIEVDVIDVHNELAFDHPCAAAAVYSRKTGYGYNPLEINLNEHSGGVQRQINEFVSLVNGTSRALGPRQESTLRNLLRDLYFVHGCYEDNPASWNKRPITEELRRRLTSEKAWSELKNYFPTVADLISFADRKMSLLAIGADNKAQAALSNLQKLIAKRNSLDGKRSSAAKRQDTAAIEDLDLQIDKVKTSCIETYQDFVLNSKTGRELQDFLAYSSVDEIRGVRDRIELLNQSGAIRSNPPDWGNARIRVHQIQHYSLPEQELFVHSLLGRIFRKRMDAGQQSGIVHAIVMDEAHRFVREEPAAIENKVVLEGRKFGIGLWMASQATSHFSDDILTSCGMLALLGMDAKHWAHAQRSLDISPNMLKAIESQRTAAIRLRKKGEMSPSFTMVDISNEACLAARQLLRSAAGA